MTIGTLRWWGYRHTNGSVQVKRYFDAQDIQEARESPYVAAVCPPFESTGREHALRYVDSRV